MGSGLLPGTASEPGEMLVEHVYGHGAFADRRGDPLDRAAADVTDRENVATASSTIVDGPSDAP
jgi:hypothetical protein